MLILKETLHGQGMRGGGNRRIKWSPPQVIALQFEKRRKKTPVQGYLDLTNVGSKTIDQRWKVGIAACSLGGCWITITAGVRPAP